MSAKLIILINLWYTKIKEVFGWKKWRKLPDESRLRNGPTTKNCPDRQKIIRVSLRGDGGDAYCGIIFPCQLEFCRRVRIIRHGTNKIATTKKVYYSFGNSCCPPSKCTIRTPTIVGNNRWYFNHGYANYPSGKMKHSMLAMKITDKILTWGD